MRSQEQRLKDQIRNLHLEPGDTIVVSNQKLLEALLNIKWHTTFPINLILVKDQNDLSKVDIPTLESALALARKTKLQSNVLEFKSEEKKVDQSV